MIDRNIQFKDISKISYDLKDMAKTNSKIYMYWVKIMTR